MCPFTRMLEIILNSHPTSGSFFHLATRKQPPIHTHKHILQKENQDMSESTNTRIIFKQEPGNAWVETKHMEVQTVPFDPETVKLEDNKVLLKMLYFSVDPYMVRPFVLSTL